MVTVRKTLKQTAESFISWPACHEKGRACQTLQTIRARTLASSYFELSPYHTHKSHRKIVSLPSYLCLLAICVFMPSPGLMPLLPAFTVFCLLFSGAVRSSWTPQRRPRGGGFGHALLGGCVDCRNKVTYTWFMGSSSSVLTFLPWQMSELMALIFSLPSSLGSFSPLLHSSAFLSANILWKIWSVLEFFLPGCSSFIFSSHIKHIYLLRELQMDNQSLCTLSQA